MTMQSMFVPARILEYIVSISVRDQDVLRRLREETGKLEHGFYQVSPEEGQLLSFLIELIGARRTLDIGTFTGYSALIAALTMGPEGRVITLDANDEWSSIGKRYWQEAGVADRIDLRLGIALDTLNGLIAEGREGQFDFAFIDADKKTYPKYYEACLKLVRDGGMIVVDNVLWRGTVADPNNTEKKALLFREFNSKLLADERVAITVLPVGDGVTLLRKRPIPR